MTETEYVGTMRWFGARFDTPMYEDMPEVPTPIGESCGYCQEPIVEGEPGVTMPALMSLDEGPIQMAIHFECNMRSIMGSPQHLDGLCSCYTGREVKSELSYRQQANVTMTKLWGSNWLNQALKPNDLTLEERADRG